MNRVTVRAPMRADLAGGTLDLWPLYLFHPGARTINVAISYFAECEISRLADASIEIALTDHDYRQRYESLSELLGDPNASLIARAVEYFRLSGIRIVTRTDAPRGSGLGGSSAMAVALVRGLSELAGEPLEGESLIDLVRDLETRLLGVPAGIQDYYPPVFGGLSALHLEPGHPRRAPMRCTPAQLAPHFILHYSEVSHFSGTNNWEIYKRQIDGDRAVREGLSRIGATAAAMEHALEEQDFPTAGMLLQQEWRNRKSLIEGISTPEIDAAIDSALSAGAWGGKVCGAGGGGCIVFLAPAERREEVIAALARVPGRTLSALPVNGGLALTTDGETASAAVPERRVRPDADSIEQLYVQSEKRGAYVPWLVMEASITFDEPRASLRRSEQRIVAVPIDWRAEKMDWSRATRFEQERLRLSAVPAEGRAFAIDPQSEVIQKIAAERESAFKQQLMEREHLELLYNPQFGLYSEANENRESFFARCREIAEQNLSEHRQQLESTFRRRMDQMKEKQEKEARDLQQEDQEQGVHAAAQEVNIAWGQVLYNMTSGRGRSTQKGVPHSVREEDYMQKIAELQRVWERELNAMRDDLERQASQIEPMSVDLEERNIEIQRAIMVWAPSGISPAPPEKGRRRRKPAVAPGASK
jgi:D-glycero-alpha-D-manno-heptose-7-phosphate kinase